VPPATPATSTERLIDACASLTSVRTLSHPFSERHGRPAKAMARRLQRQPLYKRISSASPADARCGDQCRRDCGLSGRIPRPSSAPPWTWWEVDRLRPAQTSVTRRLLEPRPNTLPPPGQTGEVKPSRWSGFPASSMPWWESGARRRKWPFLGRPRGGLAGGGEATPGSSQRMGRTRTNRHLLPGNSNRRGKRIYQAGDRVMVSKIGRCGPFLAQRPGRALSPALGRNPIADLWRRSGPSLAYAPLPPLPCLVFGGVSVSMRVDSDRRSPVNRRLPAPNAARL